MSKNVQTITQLHSSHILGSHAQNSPSQASIVHEPRIPVVQTGFRKGRGTRDQIANIRWIMENAREFQKNIFLFY